MRDKWLSDARTSGKECGLSGFKHEKKKNKKSKKKCLTKGCGFGILVELARERKRPREHSEP